MAKPINKATYDAIVQLHAELTAQGVNRPAAVTARRLGVSETMVRNVIAGKKDRPAA